MRANVDVLPYDDHDRAVKLLHALNSTIWMERLRPFLSQRSIYTTLTVNELLSKLKSAKVDRGLTAHLESPTDPHSLYLVGGSGAKTNAN
jgi:hypothetical protein